MDTATNREALFVAIYGGELVSKAKKKDEISTGDKFLVGTNAASAGLGALTLPALTSDLRSKVKNKPPSKALTVLPKTRAGKATRAVRVALKSKKFAVPVAATALGGAIFNASTDAASAASLSRKKVQKNTNPVRELKFKAVDAAETKIRENAPRAKKAVKAGAKATHETWKAEAQVSKAYEDKREVYGWASITELNGEPVVDMQGDYVTIDEIERAAHAYISKSRKGGDMHRRGDDGPVHVADLIESVVITPDKKEALGLSADSPTGWWVGMKVHDDETWNLVKDGKRPMFSIHGSGRRVEKDMEEVGKADDSKFTPGKIPASKKVRPSERKAAGNSPYQTPPTDPKGVRPTDPKRPPLTSTKAGVSAEAKTKVAAANSRNTVVNRERQAQVAAPKRKADNLKWQMDRQAEAIGREQAKYAAQRRSGGREMTHVPGKGTRTDRHYAVNTRIKQAKTARDFPKNQANAIARERAAYAQHRQLIHQPGKGMKTNALYAFKGQAGRKAKIGLKAVRNPKVLAGVAAGAAVGAGAAYVNSSGNKRKRLEADNSPNRYGR